MSSLVTSEAPAILCLSLELLIWPSFPYGEFQARRALELGDSKPEMHISAKGSETRIEQNHERAKMRMDVDIEYAYVWLELHRKGV